MNKKLWYINAALVIILAAIWTLGLMGGPKYPSEAGFEAPKNRAGSDHSNIDNLESETILAARGFSHWLDPPPAYGSITVAIEPEEARDSGAAWRVGGNKWLLSGDNAEKVSPGKKIITFKTVNEWISPKVTAEVIKDQTTEITATYSLPPQGTVKVVIEPKEVLELKPQWKVGAGDWLESGNESQKTAVGKKNITFKDIEGWDTPKVSVLVEKDKLTEVTASYDLIRYGHISLLLEPVDTPALKQAQWTIDKKTWNEFGCEPVKQRLGSYNITFNNVEDWHKPDIYSLTMDEEIQYDIVVEYLPIPYARVQVKLYPANDDRIKSAQWRIDNDKWLNFDQIAEKVTLNEHKITFKGVNGWNKPDDLIVNIEEEEITYEIDCEYVRIKPPGPKFEIIAVIETGNGNGVAFVNSKEGYKVGEVIQDFKLVRVGHGKAVFEKEGFQYEVKIKKAEPPIAPAKPKITPPAGNTPQKVKPAIPSPKGIPGSDDPKRTTPIRPGGFRRPQPSRS